jgi:hypothetical protein
MSTLDGRFEKGQAAGNKLPVGTVRIRTRHKRNGEKRAFIKVAEPNVWVLRAQFIWEQANGPIPDGFGVHHKDRDKLNDDLCNLELKSKAAHLDEHRPEFADKCVVALLRARREKLWSTRSKTGKIVGRHPANCNCPLHSA